MGMTYNQLHVTCIIFIDGRTQIPLFLIVNALIYTQICIAPVFWKNWDISLLTLAGIVVNFTPQAVQFCHQLLLTGMHLCLLA